MKVKKLKLAGFICKLLGNKMAKEELPNLTT